MKHLIKKDNLNRKTFHKIELKNFVRESVLKNKKLYTSIRWSLNSKKITFIKTKIVNRCIITGRKKGILSKFKLSRLAFLRKGLENTLPGIRL